MRILSKIFLIVVSFALAISAAEAKGKKKKGRSKGVTHGRVMSAPTCPTGLDGKELRALFPYYTHEAFEKAADPRSLDAVSGPEIKPFSKNLKISRGVYNVFAIDGDKLGVPTMDDLEPLVDVDKLSTYTFQILPVPGQCFIYVEDKIASANPSAPDNAGQEEHKSVLMLVKNKSHSDVAVALNALKKASVDKAGAKGGGKDDQSDGSEDAAAKADGDDDDDSGKKTDGSDEKVFGNLGKDDAAGDDAAPEEDDDSASDADGGTDTTAGDDAAAGDDDSAGADDDGGDDSSGG